MLPTLAKDFYLPPQHRHGTSVMLSIFCSVLLCFMSLCKGSRLTGWADLDSLPVGACVVVRVTSRPLANQGQGPVASSANHKTPWPPIRWYTVRHHVYTRWQHMQRSCIQRLIITHCTRLRWLLLLSKILLLFMRSILCSVQKPDFHWHNHRVLDGLYFCSSSYKNGLCKSEREMKFTSKSGSKLVITCTDRWME